MLYVSQGLKLFGLVRKARMRSFVSVIAQTLPVVSGGSGVIGSGPFRKLYLKFIWAQTFYGCNQNQAWLNDALGRIYGD